MTLLFKLLFPFLLLANMSLFANVFEEAGKAYNLSAKLLWSIAYKESRLNPKAINRANKNKTYDIGIMQINSAHLKWLKKDYGISEDDLFNKPKLNVFVGAMILRKCFDKHENTQNAITCYNGRIKNNPYGRDVLEILAKQERKIAKNSFKKSFLKAQLEKREREFIKVVRQKQ